jgi:SAM-dependent methyltransferase
LNALYHHTEAIHNLSAPREIVPLIMNQVSPATVLDVGCGTGTWLKIFEEHGVTDYFGVDGTYLDKTMLKIPVERFMAFDLTQPFLLQRKFDLVLSLEVAEHLDEKHADTHVQALVSHGKAILFSAAIPGQGGQNHLNEQWPAYWQQKFAAYGFYFHDVIRPRVWNNDKVDWWYRQNIFLVTKEKPSPELADALPLVHPELFLRQARVSRQYQQSLLEGKQGLFVSIRILLNAVGYKLKTLLGLKSL